MLNRIVLMGRLTRDPEIRYTQTNKPVAAYTLAVNRNYANEDGKTSADFIPCVAWGKLAVFAGDYLHKGTLITVEGRLEQRKWTDRNGNNRTTYEVIVEAHHFCESKAAAARNERPPHPADCMPPDDGFEDVSGSEDVPF